MNRWQALRAATAATLLALAAGAAAGSDIAPGKPLRIIAPAAPGGILDQTSRIVAKALSETLKQPVIDGQHVILLSFGHEQRLQLL